MDLKRKIIFYIFGFLSGILCFEIYHRWPAFFSDIDRGSYAFGLQIGENLKRNSIEVKSLFVEAGVSDGMNDNSRMTKSERKKSIDYLQSNAQQVRNQVNSSL